MTRARLLELASLSRRRERARQGLFLVEGVRAVEAAVEGGAPLTEILVSMESAGTERVASIMARARVPVVSVSAKDLARLSDAQTSQGLVGVSRTVVLQWPAERPASGRGVIVLDGVQDPGNVGTIIRTAAWFGFDAVVAGPGTADPESPKVVRAAAGGLWDLALFRAESLGAALDSLREAGLELCGADASGESVDAWRPPDRLALVLGGEANGISDEARRRLTASVGIPRDGDGRGAESLNVAVAAGVLMYRWSRPGP